MTLFEDVQRLQRTCGDLEKQVEGLEKTIEVMEERISGERGINAAIKELADRVKNNTRATWGLAATLVGASMTFAFGVLLLIG